MTTQSSTTHSEQPLIQARDLRKTFGAVTAVDGVSFQVAKGEFFGLLGPNGAGKTTCIRMLYGFSPLGGGSMNIFGLDIATQWREIRSRLGVCHQDNTLDPDLTVEENLHVFAGYFNMDRATAKRRADELLEFFALAPKKRAKVSQLSGGMARRLMLARSLINDPELIILDEPTTGLDPQSRHVLWDRLTALKARGLTMLLTTHYMDEAQRLCDRLVIVDHGTIIAEGKPMDLIRAHVGESVIELENPDPTVRELLSIHEADFDDLGERLVIYGNGANGHGELADTLRREHCGGGCLFRPAGLEDVFLRLTGRDLRE